MKKLIILFAGLVLLHTSCRKHSYYQENPNNPSVAAPALLLTNIIHSTFNVWPLDPAYASRHLTYYERANIYVNYNWSFGSFWNFDVLRQIKNMDELAQRTGEQNYRGVAKFLRAIHFISLTEAFGDIPYSEALQALEGVQKPKYDAQEDVYAGVLNELEEANNLLDPANGTLAGDIIYGNHPQQINQWKKAVNTFRLRILIHLSKKENNARLNIKQQFQSIISNSAKYPLMTGSADNFQLPFNTSAPNNSYPTYQNQSIGGGLVSVEEGFVDILKARNDPRLFKFGEPITGMPANVFTSYRGVNAGQTLTAQFAASATASWMHQRYRTSQVNEPMIFIGYAEQEFLIAEAIARNWISGAGTAAEHYNKGITASMKFYGIAQSEINNYLLQPNVVYDPNNAVPMIITQKYISFFMNSFWEPYYEQRRTGIPTFNVGPGTLNNRQIPRRWRYPQNEFNVNKANVEAAVQRQFSGNDNINGVMWVLQ